jgi:predicted nuclease of predicted toxin-antitoxin system
MRLLFDEQMSPSVARALHCLGKAVAHVGQDGQPVRGSDDGTVARAAKKKRQVLVTFNFDMVLSACEVGTRFIWFDQRGNSPTKLETAYIFLRQWDSWESRLSNPSVDCLKVGRGSIQELTLQEARKRALRRFKANQRSKARSREHEQGKQQGRLFFEEEGD